MRAIRSHPLAAVVVAMLAVFTAAGIAYAAIPDSGGVIHGCYDKKTGNLRVVDADAGGACVANEKEINWNHTGPAGTADAFARIAADGTVNTAVSKGVTDANVSHPATGIYCLRDLSFQPKIAVGNGAASIRIDGTDVSAVGYDTIVTTNVVFVNANAFLAFCDTDVGDHMATVRIYVAQAGVGLVDRPFSILLDD